MKTFNHNKTKGRKTLRQLLRENPDSGQVVIGEGTVHVDPDKIRASKNYKEMCKKLEEHCRLNHFK